jgi:outer membrane protein OmpA-like peptidoglycan-associated protein
MRRFFVGLGVVALAVAGTTACATKGFVRTEVAGVSGKVDSLGQSLEQTQERTRQNEAMITTVDRKAEGAQSAATMAQQSASAANSSATAANSRATAAADAAWTAGNKADAVDRASKRIMYTVVLSEDQGGFKFNGIQLPDRAKARLDEIIAGIKSDPKGAYFEIEGHTDNVGPADVNDRIGLGRAEEVKRYLYEQHQIPLHRINVISYGDKKPVAPNATREGRAQNRRIVVRILN